MKKYLCVLLAFALALGLCACGAAPAPAPAATAEPTPEPTPAPTAADAAALLFPSNAENRETAKAILLPLAESGDADAQYYMGYIADYGMGSKNYYDAVEWYEKAVEGGNIKATAALAYLLRYGTGIEKNTDRAAELFDRAVAAGFTELSEEELGADGLGLLALMYADGNGVAQDLDKGFELLRKAADAGSSADMCYLASYYMNNQRDYDTAFEMSQKAAELGDPLGTYAMGIMYSNGYSVEQSFTKALELWTKAADDGCCEALMIMGELYSNGYGVDVDKAKAADYYQKALDRGLLSAEEFLNACK